MKKQLLLGMVLIYCSYVYAQEFEKSVKSEITNVTVFMAGAEMNHSATVVLEKGKNKINLIGLSPKLDPKSIMVNIEPKDITILSVFSRTNYLTPKNENKKIKFLKDSLMELEDQEHIISNSKETLDKEKLLLYRHDGIISSTKGTTVVEIEKIADFFRKRNDNLNVELFKLEKDEHRLKNSINNIKKQLEELNAVLNPPSSEVTVVLMSNQNTTAKFELKYYVEESGWGPKYDIRTEGISKPISLIYRANLYNNSGIDWKDVKLKLSTADPNQGAEKPQMTTWNINEDNDNSLKEVIITNNVYSDRKIADSTKAYKQVAVEELSAEFDIPVPYSILSDSKPYTVEVTSFNLPAKYEHFCIPKMEKDAFLVAKISGWNDLNLVSGPANVYFNGNYIGQSTINTLNITDTLVLSLGRDKKITTTRSKRADSKDHQVIGNNTKQSFVFETLVRNNRETAINIEVQDQVPVSDNKEVSIDVSEMSNATYDKATGKLIWKLSILPGDTKKLCLHIP
jgi:uncharacterized protein (TIGR02231 family)